MTTNNFWIKGRDFFEEFCKKASLNKELKKSDFDKNTFFYISNGIKFYFSKLTTSISHSRR